MVETLLRARYRGGRLDWREVWEARDLVFLLVRRDLMTKYAHTILGPLWFLIQPVGMAIVFWLAINKGAGVLTGGVPTFLFNLSSLLPWLYFSQTFTAISSTFTASSDLFRKVYFPRVAIPLAVSLSSLFSLAIQFLLFLFVLGYECIAGNWASPGWSMLLFPLLTLQLVGLTLGVGLCMTALTVRFRDLVHALQFITLVLMFVSLVFIPMANIQGGLVTLAWFNPLAVIIENFRLALLGTGGVGVAMTMDSVLLTLLILMLGLAMFQRASRTAVDLV